MKYKKFFEWFTLDIVIFLVFNVVLIYYFQDRFYVLFYLTYFQLIILGLATFRAANILSNEVITKPLRAAFVDEVKKEGKIIEEPKRSGFLGAFGELIYCPSCTGVWFATVLVYSFIFWPAPTFVVALFLALSSIERIISAVIVRLKLDK